MEWRLTRRAAADKWIPPAERYLVPPGKTNKDVRITCRNLIDQNAATNWEASLDKDQEEFWVEAAFDQPTTIACFNIARGDEWSPRHTIELQVPDGSKGWRSITPESLKLEWETMKFLDEPVTTDRVRMRIADTKRFVFAEFELFPPLN